jgi:glycosyltransferase involved in cell wall biosynthesis
MVQMLWLGLMTCVYNIPLIREDKTLMNILFLAPHPFYQDRGTPIAVNLLLRALCERGDKIDLVTYHEGKTIEHNNVNVYRIFNIPFVRNIRPGFSWKKLVCDFFMFLKVSPLVFKKRYQVIHAVEESVFIAMFLKFWFKIPYIYDMDSSISEQIVEKYPTLGFLNPLLKFLEKIAIRSSEVVVPVCDSLASFAEKYNPKRVVTLRDVSLLQDVRETDQTSLKKELGIGDSLIVMYVGNLEAYQGIDLLLESFALALKKSAKIDLVIVGGSVLDIQKYKDKSFTLGIGDKVHFLGPKPVESLGDYLSQADILVSTKIKGGNTPMKIYSYLHSGKAVLATELSAHTQVLDSRVALLSAPLPDEFSKKMLSLIGSSALRLQLGEAGKKLLEEQYSHEYFKKELYGLYGWLEARFVKEDRRMRSS